LIKNGESVRPVQGITIAGNLKEIFAGVRLFGSDLPWFGFFAGPGFALSEMTLAEE